MKEHYRRSVSSREIELLLPSTEAQLFRTDDAATTVRVSTAYYLMQRVKRGTPSGTPYRIYVLSTKSELREDKELDHGKLVQDPDDAMESPAVTVVLQK